MEADPLSATFAALADPTRRAILARLARGSATVKELSAPFKVSGPAISRHLRVLQRAGLITQSRQAQWRPCRIEPAPLKAVADWTGAFRHFWDENLDRLDEYLREVQTGRTSDKNVPAKKTPANTKEKRHGRSRRKK